MQPAILKTSDLINENGSKGMLNISRSTFRKVRASKDFPQPISLAGIKGWRRTDIEEWINKGENK